MIAVATARHIVDGCDEAMIWTWFLMARCSCARRATEESSSASGGDSSGKEAVVIWLPASDFSASRSEDG